MPGGGEKGSFLDVLGSESQRIPRHVERSEEGQETRLTSVRPELLGVKLESSA